MDVDNGLSKEGVKEVLAIVEKSFSSLKNDFENSIGDLKATQAKSEIKFDTAIKELRSDNLKIQKTLIDLQFKHNWRTAFWVFVGASTPIALKTIFDILK